MSKLGVALMQRIAPLLVGAVFMLSGACAQGAVLSEVAGIGGAVGMSGANAPDSLGLGNAAMLVQPKSSKSQREREESHERRAQQEAFRLPSQPELPGEFEAFVSEAVNKPIRIYGHNLFAEVPDTFSPLSNVPVTPDYPVGPGDEILIRAWGQVDIDLSAEVDRNGMVVLPKVGAVNVAGVAYRDLQAHLKRAIGRVFRHFDLNVTLGQLRSIQVFVVGQARRPGAYTVSSLSTLINTVFASGGPSLRGSLRHIQVKRNGAIMTELDLYDFLLKGDKSRDVALQPGDVIYIPPVGQLAAIAGSVNSPAIYELRGRGATLAELIEMAGGLSTVAEGGKIRVERIDDRKTRKVEEYSLDRVGLERGIKDGDVVQVGSISGQFANAVTLRGYVASPGRYPWREGMRVADLIPDRDALVVPEYWSAQNRIHLRNDGKKIDKGRDDKRTGDFNSVPEKAPISQDGLRLEIKKRGNEINWEYALVERLNKSDMTTMLLSFNLAKALAQDAEHNLQLQPGDVITIFSQQDIGVPQAKKSVYVKLEGEFSHPGVYRALPGETLRRLVERVGGVTAQAYLFGGELSRESTRVLQQKHLDEMLDRMEADVSRRSAESSGSAMSKDDVDASKTILASQKELIAKMRQIKAAGRVVMDLPEEGAQVKDLPDVELEDGDRLYVPATMSTVNVMGAVYNQNAFIYKKGAIVDDYLARSGGVTRDGDDGDVYLVRINGEVISSRNRGWFGGAGRGGVTPGATIVVPEKLDKYSLTKTLKDWTQIFYQFAIGVASLKTIGLVR